LDSSDEDLSSAKSRIEKIFKDEESDSINHNKLSEIKKKPPNKWRKRKLNKTSKLLKMKQKKKSNKEDDTDNLKFKKEFKAEVYYSDKESTKMKNKEIQYHIKRFKKK